MNKSATIRSAVLSGIESRPVTVTATPCRDASNLPITGMSDVAARETRVRVKSALAQYGIEARAEITITPEVTFASGLDLAIALAVAALYGKTSEPDATVIGELSLTGNVLAVRGALVHARAVGKGGILVPAQSAADAAMTDAGVFYCSTLGEALQEVWERAKNHKMLSTVDPSLNLSDIQSVSVRRALEIAAAGNHSILLLGGPGAGKTFAARRLVNILPELTRAEAIEVATIHDAAGLRSGAQFGTVTRPFRAPHYTVSEIGLLGGGDRPRPGEVTLAHHGVLFLDEIAEFRRSAIEAFARVLREGKTTVYRRSSYEHMPASPFLVGASNLCACGYRGDETGRCVCDAERMKRWRERAASYEGLFAIRAVVTSSPITRAPDPSAEPNDVIRKRVTEARRFIATMNSKIAPEAQKMVDDATDRKICGRGSLPVACTIAALAGSELIRPEHMAEAIALCGERA